MQATEDATVRLVFLSYSRRDAPLVRKLQLLVRASGGFPWRDEEAIGPGERWRMAIATAIDRSERVLVFWCSHANRSSEVRREYRLALTLNKMIVPITLDRTETPSDLADFQAMDVSGLVRVSHVLLRVERWLWVLGLFALAAWGIRYAGA